MTFTESNTVEQMILETVSSRARGAGALVAHETPGPGWDGSLGGELRPTRWDYVPGAQLPRQSGDVMVEPWVREALIRLNPEKSKRRISQPCLLRSSITAVNDRFQSSRASHFPPQ